MGIGFTTYQVWERITYYLKYPTAVDVRMNFNNSLRYILIAVMQISVLFRT